MDPLEREKGLTVVRLERELAVQQERGSVGQLPKPTQPYTAAREVPLTIETQLEAALAEFHAVGGTNDDLRALREEAR